MSDFLQLHVERKFLNPMTMLKVLGLSISIISVSMRTESQHRSFLDLATVAHVDYTMRGAGLSSVPNILGLKERSATSCNALDRTRTFVKECSVYFGQCSLHSVLRIHEVLSHYSTHYSVHSHMFFSWQVNGSDGMYKYEEIILERVSIKSFFPLLTCHCLTYSLRTGWFLPTRW